MGDTDMSPEMIQIPIAASSMFPGFKFSPTDEELISYYLNKKIQGFDRCVQVIPEVDICGYEPWDLPAKSIIQSENEWFFFSARGRKYPNGSQSRRATESGYWKATGKERNVKSGSNVIGTKRTLVFHKGRAPKGERTEWIMHEYCMSGISQDSVVVCRLRKNNEFRLNDAPRKNSQRHLSTGDNITPSVSEDGFEDGVPHSQSQRHLSTENNITEGGTPPTGVFDDDKAADCCSKEGTSSYNYIPDGTGSDSEQNLTHELSQHGSSSHQKEEDDCFADIMKDDIIKLDESSVSTTHDLVPHVARGAEAEVKFSSPSPPQGTANRRIRLRRLRGNIHHAKPSETLEAIHEHNKGLNSDSKQSAKYLWSLFSNTGVSINRRCLLVILVTGLCWLCFCFA